jgi:hypothetical protein
MLAVGVALMAFAAATRVIAELPAADQRKFNAPDPSVDAPRTTGGESLDDLRSVLVLNLTPLPGTDEPAVLADVNDRRGVRLKLRDGEQFPLRAAIKAEKARVGDKFRVLINAPRKMRFAAFQLVLIEIAIAGVTDYGFVVRPAAEDLIGADALKAHAPEPALRFLAASMPVKSKDVDPKRDKPDGMFEVLLSNDPIDGRMRAQINGDEKAYANGGELAGALEARLRAALAKGGDGAPTAYFLIITPRLATTMDHVVTAYEAATHSKFTLIGFQRADE